MGQSSLLVAPAIALASGRMNANRERAPARPRRQGDQMKRREFITLLGGAILLSFSTFLCGSMAANAAPVRMVAIDASNTHGWYLGNQGAYPAQLQTLLRAKGIDAQVINAGVPFDTTAVMLRRIDKDVPKGTDIAILQPGGNDRPFFRHPATEGRQYCGNGAPVAGSRD